MKKHLTTQLLSSGLCAALLLFASCNNADQEEVSAVAEDKTFPVPQLTQKSWEPIPGRYIVKFKNSLPPSNGRADGGYDEMVSGMKNFAATYMTKVGIQSPKVIHAYVGDLEGFAAQMTEAEADLLETDPDGIIEFVTLDRTINRVNPVGEVETLSPAATATRLRGADQTYGVRRVMGPQVVPMRRAFVLDGGVDLDHPELKVDLRMSRSFCTRNPLDASSPDDFDPVGHGTHVAGTIAARSDGRGVSGVAADANIVAIKVLDLDGVGSFADIIAGVNYVAMVGRAGDVANMSLGAGPINTSVIANDPISVAFRNACTAGASRGIFMVYAAGNDGLPAQFYIPAAYKGTNMWTIAAMNDADRFPAFSNWGPLIDFTEPGVDVISTYPGGGYAMLSGTSMAAPHFAGIVLATGGRPQNGGNVLNAALRAGTPATIGVLRR